MPYIEQLVAGFWEYRRLKFQGREQMFDEPVPRNARPPVFIQIFATGNILVDPSLTEEQTAAVYALLPRWERHRWFRSMKSSQALVQSVFANLRVMGLCDLLRPALTDEGFGPFLPVTAEGGEMTLEHKLSTLGEPRPTSIDIDVQSVPHVVVECKLAEDGVGQCSRPTLGEKEVEYCDGNYQRQKGRDERCALTRLGIRYWEFIPQLFTWGALQDHLPCPVRSPYQLVRNVLAASVTPEGALRDGVAVLLFDARNPAFQPGGRGHQAYSLVKSALRQPARLQRMTWQTLLEVLRKDPRLDWLTSELNLKYGFSPTPAKSPGSSRE